MERTQDEKRIFNHIRNVLLTHDPMYLAFHNEKFKEPIAADPANHIKGGYFASLRLEYLVGFVRFLLMENGSYTLQFGRNQTDNGKLVFKTILVIENVAEDAIVSCLKMYDDKSKPLVILGATTTAQTKKRRR